MDHRQEWSTKSHYQVSMVDQTRGDGGVSFDAGNGEGVRQSKNVKVLCLRLTWHYHEEKNWSGWRHFFILKPEHV